MRHLISSAIIQRRTVWAHNRADLTRPALETSDNGFSVASLLSFFPVPLSACSAVGCLSDGVEVNQYFAVMVKHGGRPLAGVAVEITGEGREQFSGLTSTDGKVQVDLSPGGYWLKAELLGISAAYECFHINEQSSKSAKRKLTYDWGDLAPATRQIAGKLVDSQPGKDGPPLWNLLHRTEVPISGATLRLRDPIAGTDYSTLSDSNGAFVFDLIPPATYVLHVEGGAAGDRGYDATDLLIKLNPKASRDELLLTRRDTGAGSCDGTSLELQSVN